jgi:hypothetical protein
MWVSIAAVIIMIGWFKSKSEAEKHATFRTIVERTGAVDEAQLKLLFDTRTTSPGRHSPLRVRVIGALVMFIAIGALIVVGWTVLSMFELTPAPDLPLAGGLWSIFVAALGVGFFLFSARGGEKASVESEQGRVGSHEE